MDLDKQWLRRARLEANGLWGEEIGSGVVGVIRQLVGVQGQERGAAELAWQPRSRTVVRQDVARALDGEGEEGPALVRTWAMRGTIHVLAAKDIDWLLALLGPLFVRKGQRRRGQLGLDEAVCARATAVMREALGGGMGMTRAEVAARLAVEGVPVEGQAVYHLLYRAGLEGVICFGADRDGEHTFVLLQEWLGEEQEPLQTAAAIARLAERYFQGYGPASVRDFATWSGLGMREARAGVAAVGETVTEGEETLYGVRGQPAVESGRQGMEARLLPAFDSFLLGYASRALIVPAAFERQVHPGGGMIRPVLLVDGVAAGTWRLRDGEVAVTPFERLDGEAARAVEEAVGAMGSYLGETRGDV